MARNALTAVNAQQRANTIPRLPRAKTGAWGFVKGGKWVWIIVVHSVARGWQAIGILLGGMGETQSPIQCPTEGSLVPSSMCRPVMYQKPTLERGGGGGRSDAPRMDTAAVGVAQQGHRG